jgi:hypothetical protein
VIHQDSLTRSEATEAISEKVLRSHHQASETRTSGNEHRSSDPKKNHKQPDAVPVFVDALTSAVSQLKNRLQQHYEQTYPSLRDITRFVIDEEEAKARDLSNFFPHLVLPDLVETPMAQLGLQVVASRPDDVLAPPAFAGIQECSAQAVEQFL